MYLPHIEKKNEERGKAGIAIFGLLADEGDAGGWSKRQEKCIVFFSSSMIKPVVGNYIFNITMKLMHIILLYST